MRKVSLFLLAIFLFLLAVLAASPYLIGYHVKANLLLTVDALGQHNDRFKISVLEYKQGWLSSDAKLKISLPLPPNPQSNESLTFTEIIDSHINHGPLLLNTTAKNFDFGLAHIESKVFFPDLVYTSDFSDHAFIHFSTFIDFKNNWHSQFTQSAISFSIANLLKFSSQGLTGSWDFHVKNNFINKSQLVFHSQGISTVFIASPIIREVNLEALSYENRSQQQASGIWTGLVKIAVPKITINKMDNSQIIVQDSIIDNTTANPSSNLYDFSLHFAVKNIQTATTLLPNLGPLDFTIGFNHLNLDGLQALSTFFKSLHHQPLTPEERLTYMNMLPKVLTPTTFIVENISANTPFGTLKNDGSLSWKNDKNMPTTLQDMAQTLIATINLRAASALVDRLLAAQMNANPSAEVTPAVNNSLNAPASTAATTDIQPSTAASTITEAPKPPTDAAPAEPATPSLKQVFDSWIEKGYILKEGGDYVVLIKFENGAATLNGKPLPQ